MTGDGGPSAIRSTNIGSWPGTDLPDAVGIAFAECPDLPYLPELPARGPHAQLVGRTTALLSGMAVDLQPAGWRLTDGSGRDHRLAVATFRSDLDVLEEYAQGYAGLLKIAVGGPWTLAATMERPRGDRVLADNGARRDLGQSLTEGLVQLVGELARRLPQFLPMIQLDEPMLPMVLAGAVPTASGFSRHRAVDLPEVHGSLRSVIDALHGAGSRVGVHCCASAPPVDLVRQTGADAVLVDASLLATSDWDAAVAALESGTELGLGVLAADTRPATDRLARSVLERLRTLQLDPELAVRALLLTPACGLAGRSRTEALTALRALRESAAVVTDQLLG